MKKFFVWASVIAIIVAAFAIYQHSPRSPKNRAYEVTTSQQPIYPSDSNAGLILPMVQLEGDWTWKKDDTAFNATVHGQDIKIVLTSSDGSSMTYWHGTFKSEDSLGSTITSTKTESPDEIVISQSTTKDFKIDSDNITFTFSAMGVSRPVMLTR
jgi:hypothetical protein